MFNKEIMEGFLKTIAQRFKNKEVAIVKCLDGHDAERYVLTVVEVVPDTAEREFMPIGEVYLDEVPEFRSPNKDGNPEIVACQQNVLANQHQMWFSNNKTKPTVN